MVYPIVTDIILAHRFLSPAGWTSNEYALAREHHGIVYALEGRAEYCLHNGDRFRIEAGDCLYVPRGTRYVIGCGREMGFVHMTVNFDLLEDGGIFPVIMHRTLSQPRHFQQAFTGLVRTWTLRHPNYREKCMSLLYELIYLLQCEVQAAPHQHMQRLSPACLYLDEHFCEDFPLGILPSLCKLSPTYFRRLFHSVFHETPAEYRRRLRIARACDLLLAGQHSIEAVAELCGYPDAAYFTRMFTKTMGQPPSHYKKSLLEMERRPE